MKINNNKQELKIDNGTYLDDVICSTRRGRFILYYKYNNRYEGDLINNKREGKEIIHYNNDDRYEGDVINIKKEGKGYIILIMVIDMKSILKIIKKKEKE